MKPAIYVASRVHHAEMWREIRKCGCNIVSSWIDEAGEGQTMNYADLWSRVENEIRHCTALVFFAKGNDDFPMKGALVEIGMALAFGKPVFAALENVEIEPKKYRPVGSWLHHENVVNLDSLNVAIWRANRVK